MTAILLSGVRALVLGTLVFSGAAGAEPGLRLSAFHVLDEGGPSDGATVTRRSGERLQLDGEPFPLDDAIASIRVEEQRGARVVNCAIRPDFRAAYRAFMPPGARLLICDGHDALSEFRVMITPTDGFLCQAESLGEVRIADLLRRHGETPPVFFTTRLMLAFGISTFVAVLLLLFARRGSRRASGPL